MAGVEYHPKGKPTDTLTGEARAKWRADQDRTKNFQPGAVHELPDGSGSLVDTHATWLPRNQRKLSQKEADAHAQGNASSNY